MYRFDVHVVYRASHRLMNNTETQNSWPLTDHIATATLQSPCVCVSVSHSLYKLTGTQFRMNKHNSRRKVLMHRKLLYNTAFEKSITVLSTKLSKSDQVT